MTKTTPLLRGQIAPPFQAQTYTGEAVSLADYEGRKLWLGFFRYAACPMCNNRVREIIESYREFERAGISIVAVFQSTPERIASHVAKQAPPFPLVADPDLELYGRYQVGERWLGFLPFRVTTAYLRAARHGFGAGPVDGPKARIPADFLIDPEGLLWAAYYGAAISDHIPFATVSEFVADDCLDMPASRA